MTEQPAKPCALCGKDCTGQPRLKDAQGRYLHRACAERMQQKQGAKQPARPKPAKPSASVAGGEHAAIMDTLLDEAAANAPEPCPGCGRPIARDSMLCVHCGYNRNTGKSMRTRMLKAEKVKGEKRERSRAGIAISPGAGAGIALGIFATLGIAGFAVHPAFITIYIVLWFAFALAAWIWSIGTAFQDREVGWGVALIVAPFVCVGGLINFYYVFLQSDRDNLKACYASAMVAGLAFYPMMITGLLSVPGFNEQLQSNSAFAAASGSGYDEDELVPEYAYYAGDYWGIEPEVDPDEPVPETGPTWARGSLIQLIGAKPSEDFRASFTAQSQAQEGDDLETVERALWQAAQWTTAARMPVDEAIDQLLLTRSIEDYPDDIQDYTIRRFRAMTDTERRNLFRWVSRAKLPPATIQRLADLYKEE
ncbi:MAG: hypothetical protein R3B49_01635 [Phycisphaerales bacterium]